MSVNSPSAAKQDKTKAPDRKKTLSPTRARKRTLVDVILRRNSAPPSVEDKQKAAEKIIKKASKPSKHPSERKNKRKAKKLQKAVQLMEEVNAQKPVEARAAAHEKVQTIHEQIAEVKGIMHGNMEKLMQRHENLGNLHGKSEELLGTSTQFQKTSTELKKEVQIKNLILLLVLVGLFLGTLGGGVFCLIFEIYTKKAFWIIGLSALTTGGVFFAAGKIIQKLHAAFSKSPLGQIHELASKKKKNKDKDKGAKNAPGATATATPGAGVEKAIFGIEEEENLTGEEEEALLNLLKEEPTLSFAVTMRRDNTRIKEIPLPEILERKEPIKP